MTPNASTNAINTADITFIDVSMDEEKDAPNKCVFCNRASRLNVCQKCMKEIDCCKGERG